MSGKWMVGALAVFVALGVAGVGFAAFTDVNVVNGTASAGTVAIQMTPLANDVHFPGHAVFSGLSEAQDQVTLTAWNLMPGDYPHEGLTITNIGTVPATVTVTLAGDVTMVSVGGLNGYDVHTASGLSAFGGSFTVVWVTLNPGASATDVLYVGIPAGSTVAPVPGTFTVTYTATAGT
jgi:predicted ribosomally synthesized peptide with SipW-like signal peptide